MVMGVYQLHLPGSSGWDKVGAWEVNWEGNTWSRVGQGAPWPQYKPDKSLANPMWAPEQRLAGRGITHRAENARLQTPTMPGHWLVAPSKEFGLSSNAGEDPNRGTARSCQLRPCCWRTRHFLKETKAVHPIAVHRTCPSWLSNHGRRLCHSSPLVSDVSPTPENFTLLHHIDVVTGDMRLPTPEVAPKHWVKR